jgi:quinol monooxygenase YgiN
LACPRRTLPGTLLGATLSALLAGPAPAEDCCPILELRQYTLHPGRRDVLIELFDREFVETQEAFGMRIVGQFRDLDRPDRFVWLRGFPSMDERARALAGFYGGSAWKANSKAANATMIDAANVLLLHPARAGSGFRLAGSTRPEPGSLVEPRHLVTATIYSFDGPPGEDFRQLVDRDIRPALVAAGASVLAAFATESSPNTFPSLPVREGENVFVLFSVFEDAAAYERHLAALARSKRWTEAAAPALTRLLKGPPETLRLSPTSRSLLGAGR